MTAELETLATAAAHVLVALMATDVWSQGRAHVLRVWRRNRPDQARQVEIDLARAATEVGVARRCRSVDDEQGVREEWRTRIAELLASSPRARREMREAVSAMTILQRYADGAAMAPGPVTNGLP
jgi:hypothetical protein